MNGALSGIQLLSQCRRSLVCGQEKYVPVTSFSAVCVCVPIMNLVRDVRLLGTGKGSFRYVVLREIRCTKRGSKGASFPYSFSSFLFLVWSLRQQEHESNAIVIADRLSGRGKVKRKVLGTIFKDIAEALPGADTRALLPKTNIQSIRRVVAVGGGVVGTPRHSSLFARFALETKLARSIVNIFLSCS